jgi:hypothetical protein
MKLEVRRTQIDQCMGAPKGETEKKKSLVILIDKGLGDIARTVSLNFDNPYREHTDGERFAVEMFILDKERDQQAFMVNYFRMLEESEDYDMAVLYMNYLNEKSAGVLWPTLAGAFVYKGATW